MNNYIGEAYVEIVTVDYFRELDYEYIRGPLPALDEVLEVQLSASEALFRTDFLVYRAALIQFKQDQEAEDEKESTEESVE